jgi:cytochrome P450
VAGHLLPAGTTVMPSIALLQHSDAWSDPGEFRPERWLDGDSPQPYGFIPFGGGVRRCIGASFATMEMKTVLRTVLSRVELAASNAKPEGTRVHHVTLVPSRGARVEVERRLADAPGAGSAAAGTAAGPAGCPHAAART